MANKTDTTTTTNILHEAVLVQVHAFIDQDIYTSDITAFYEWIHNHTTTHRPYPYSFIIEVHSLEYDLSARHTIHIDHEHEHDNNCTLDIIYYNDASLINFNIENSSDPSTFQLPATSDDNYDMDDTDTTDIGNDNDNDNNNEFDEFDYSPCKLIITV
jgi:hypothetical protein